MFYSPTSLADGADALDNGSLRSILVTGIKGEILVTRRDEKIVHNDMTQSDYMIPRVFVVGISDRFRTVYLRKGQTAYTDAATALLAAQRIAAGESGLYDAIKTGDMMNGFDGRHTTLDATAVATQPCARCAAKAVAS